MEFGRRLKPAVHLDLIPMIDVVFQLVLFFLVSTTFIITPGINLNLPRSQTSEPVLVSKMVITVLSEEEIYLNKVRYTLRTLEPPLAAMTREQKEQVSSVLIEGDERVSYRTLIGVLDILRKQGFRGIGLKTMDLRLLDKKGSP
ncbi:MAG: biopolymer transporter ExbD [Spirochaetes bacterium]|nr:biopolymer transporter ExbD [Spirochaetota bacterium]